MNAQPPANELATFRDGVKCRNCPSCGRRVDVSHYGCHHGAAEVVCPGCGDGVRLDAPNWH